MTDLLDQAIALWQDCPTDMPDFEQPPGVTYSTGEQRSNENEFDLFLQSVKSELASLPHCRKDRIAAQSLLRPRAASRSTL